MTFRHRVDVDADPVELYAFDDDHPTVPAGVRWYVGCGICERARMAAEAPSPPHRVVDGPSCGSGVEHCTCAVCWPATPADGYSGNRTTGVTSGGGGGP